MLFPINQPKTEAVFLNLFPSFEHKINILGKSCAFHEVRKCTAATYRQETADVNCINCISY